MESRFNDTSGERPQPVGIGEIFMAFGKIGLVSFGGPAGQIALMHRVLVEEKRWLDEQRFLHALNFCMLLPGPEAMQLATYSGWLLRGVGGGVLAGLLFVLPGLAILLALSVLYALHGDVPMVAGLLFGLKAAVLAIIFQALLRVAARALKGRGALGLALGAFLMLAILDLPFPLVILLAAVAGLTFPSAFAANGGERHVAGLPARPIRHLALTGTAAMALWLAPLACAVALLSADNVFLQQALFFSKAAVVTFGGAYAVLAYVSQQAVEAYGWLSADAMLTGLGLAETTPGPLILVLVFAGFMGAFQAGGESLLWGIGGGLLTAWVTFIPCFIWIFAGAPFMEVLRGQPRLNGSFAAITAAVVGVIANLALWFAVNVLFAERVPVEAGDWRFDLPVPASLDLAAASIALLAGLMAWRGAGTLSLLAVAAGAGIAVKGLLLA